MKAMKKTTPWRSRIFIRYLGYQIPGWGLWPAVLLLLRHWFELPWWLAPGALGVLVAKDLILFPYVWRAYAPLPPEKRPLDGSRGVVVKPLSPQGYIRIQGELWRAEVRSEEVTVLPGKTVEVQGNKGLTLFVDPASEEMEDPGGAA
jgi:membrane protein implicated in regulation of membrane protease activity